MQTVPTGIENLDKKIGGGYRKGSIVLLEYDTGSPSDAFLREFAKAGLDNDEYCMVLTMMHSPRLIADDQDMIDNGRLILLDSFTNAHNWKEAQSKEKYAVNNIDELKDIHNVMRKAFTKEKVPEDAQVRGVFDSLNPLYFSLWRRRSYEVALARIGEFVHHQSVLAKKHDSCWIYTLQAPSSMRMNDLVDYLENISDYVMQMSKKKVKNSYTDVFRIKKASGSHAPAREYGMKATRKKVGIKVR